VQLARGQLKENLTTFRVCTAHERMGRNLLQDNTSSLDWFLSPILSSILSDGRFAPFSNLLGIAGTFTEIVGVTVRSILAPVFNFGFGLLQSDPKLI